MDMQSPNRSENLPEANSIFTAQGISKIVALAVIVLIVIFGVYIYKFGTLSFSNSHEAWGQFGDYIGGTANPIFGFLSFIALILTLGIQNRQLQVSAIELELSRKELEMTRIELARSATAQEASEKALREQAEVAYKTTKLNTISFLLNKYSAELAPYVRNHYPTDSVQNREKVRLTQRCNYLEEKLEEVFNELQLREEEFHG